MEDQKQPNSELQVYLNLLREKMPQQEGSYQVKTLAVFGSYLHQNEDEESDLDLLVEFRQTPTLFQFIRLENYLSELLGVEVDLVMKDSLKPSIGERVLKEAEPV